MSAPCVQTALGQKKKKEKEKKLGFSVCVFMSHYLDQTSTQHLGKQILLTSGASLKRLQLNTELLSSMRKWKGITSKKQ